MSKVSIWLDDERKMPSRFDHHVKTAKEAIKVIRRANEEEGILRISLDHDLGKDCGNGYEVATFIEEAAFMDQLLPFDLFIHTANPSVRKKMLQACLNAARFWELNHNNITVVVQVVDPKTHWG